MNINFIFLFKFLIYISGNISYRTLILKVLKICIQGPVGKNLDEFIFG